MMTQALTAFGDGCLQKAMAKEPKPSIKELSRLAEMKDRPTHKTGDKAKEKRKTREECANTTSRTPQKLDGHSVVCSFQLRCCDTISEKSSSRVKGLILAESLGGIESIMEERCGHRQRRHQSRKLATNITTLWEETKNRSVV